MFPSLSRLLADVFFIVVFIFFFNFRSLSLQSPIVSVVAMSTEGKINVLQDNATITFRIMVNYCTDYAFWRYHCGIENKRYPITWYHPISDSGIPFKGIIDEFDALILFLLNAKEPLYPWMS